MRWTAALFLLILTAPAGTALAQQASPRPEPGEATFIVFVQSRDLGRERVTLRRTDDGGWTIASEGALSPPLDFTLRQFEAQYGPDWKPRSLIFEAIPRGGLLSLRTTFSGTTAASAITTTSGSTTKTDLVSADTVVLPNNAFAAYEALAARLSVLSAGAELLAYVAPEAEIAVRLTDVVSERIQTPARTFTARRHKVEMMNPRGPLPVEVWSDDRQRLVRISIPSVSLEVVRSDVASVASRVQTFARANDEDARIPSVGFSLAATVSKPLSAPAGQRLPAVVLVPGSGLVDRDETVAGIPIFGQLASALADAGYLVVRYDKRGVAQSGGRAESTTLSDYAEDVRAIVRYLDKRKDVDRRHIAVAGHSEGGFVALLAASREKKIAALVLIATPGTTGAELVLEQQRRLLDRLGLPDAEKQAKIDLQTKIQAAVLTGRGWEGVPPDLRRQADSPWFQSLLAFDPAKVMPKVRQPILVVQGSLDRQVDAAHAPRLAALARARKRGGEAAVVALPGINHLLVPAKTGEVDEYASLPDKTVSPEAIAAIGAWLQRTLAPPVKALPSRRQTG